MTGQTQGNFNPKKQKKTVCERRGHHSRRYAKTFYGEKLMPYEFCGFKEGVSADA